MTTTLFVLYPSSSTKSYPKEPRNWKITIVELLLKPLQAYPAAAFMT